MVEKRKFIISLFLGYLSLSLTRFTISVDFAYDLFFFPGIVIPLIVGMLYGGRYALICCTLGLSMFQPFFVWQFNGMANIAYSFFILIYSVGNGICRKYIKEKDETFVIQYLFQLIFILSFLLVDRPFIKMLVRCNKYFGIQAYTYLPDNIINANGIFLLEVMTISIFALNLLLMLPCVKKWLKEPIIGIDRYSYSVVGILIVVLFLTTFCSAGNTINNLLCITVSVNDYQSNVGTVQLALLKAVVIIFAADFVAHFIHYYCRQQQYQIEMAKIQDAVFESSQDLIWSINGINGRILTSNHMARNFFISRNNQYNTIPFIDIFDKEEVDLWQDSFEKVEEEKHYSTEFYDKGTDHFYDIQMHWIDLAQGQHDIAVFAKDITSEVLLNEKIKEYNDELENRVLERTKEIQAVNNELEQFGYMVAHELKAPLRAIDLYNQIMKEESKDIMNEEMASAEEMISSYCNKAIDLVTGILNYSKMKTQKFQLVKIHMNRLIEDVINDLKKVNINQIIQVKVAEMPNVMGDEMLLQCCIYNILSNAVKYSAMRDVTVIDIKYKQNDKEHIFSFQDNGIGFSMNESGKLFQLFERVHSDSEFEGTGIGLVTVKKIIEKHGGKIKINAKVNEGCNVTFSLPK